MQIADATNIDTHRITDVTAQPSIGKGHTAVHIFFGRNPKKASLSLTVFASKEDAAKVQALADAINAAGFASLPAEEEDEPEPPNYDDALATKLGREDALDAKLRDAGRGHLVR